MQFLIAIYINQAIVKNNHKNQYNIYLKHLLNYIAHIHQAHLSDTSLLGNFLGDFVKGSDLSHLPEDIAHGVKLHRKIDTFTDTHSIVVTLRQSFPTELRRISGVVIDVYFDHMLCKHWQKMTQYRLDSILNQFYQQLQTHDLKIGGRFSQVQAGLLEFRWLQNYENKESCYRAFYQIEKRLRHRIKFAENAKTYIRNNEKRLEKAFLAFYPQLSAFSRVQANGP